MAHLGQRAQEGFDAPDKVRVLRIEDANRGKDSCGGHLLVEPNQRQQDMKGRALGEFAFHFDLPGMFLDNSVHDGQAESRAVILGRKEGIEDVRDVFAANAFAVVANRDAQEPRARPRSCR